MTSPSIRSSTAVHVSSKERERLETGLRILARMIARAYKRRLQDTENRGVGDTKVGRESRLAKGEEGDEI